MSHPHSPEFCAGQLRVLADDTRLRVISALMQGPLNVGEINRRTRVSQSLLSHHLRILRDARLVIARRRGKAVEYSLRPGAVVGRGRCCLDLGCCRLAFPAAGGDRKQRV